MIKEFNITAMVLFALLSTDDWEKNLKGIGRGLFFFQKKIKPLESLKSTKLSQKNIHLEKLYTLRKNLISESLEGMLYSFKCSNISIESLREMENNLPFNFSNSLGKKGKLIFKIISNYYYNNQNFEYTLEKSIHELGGIMTITSCLKNELNQYLSTQFDICKKQKIII